MQRREAILIPDDTGRENSTPANVPRVAVGAGLRRGDCFVGKLGFQLIEDTKLSSEKLGRRWTKGGPGIAAPCKGCRL